MNRSFLAITAALFIVILGSILAISYAKGYTLDINNKEVKPTGILVATSDPNGAEVQINGELKTATNNTINLDPGSYKVKIQLDGFYPWEKTIQIRQEEVFKTNVFLFPRVPDLRPLTLTGANNPSLSLDESKIAYGVASASAEKDGIWILDMGRSLPGPLAGNAEFRQISLNSDSQPFSQAKYLWSPDGRELIAYFGEPLSLESTPSGQVAYLFETDKINQNPPIITASLPEIVSDWKAQLDSRKQAQFNKLPPKLKTFFAENTIRAVFPPDESKILYEATRSATLVKQLKNLLPGTNPTKEERELKPGLTYVYDLKEDKNYKITGENIKWFPSSRHLISHTDKEIAVMDYDGTNKAIVYAGPFTNGYIFPWPNWTKVVILTSLNLLAGTGENLYTINLR